MAFRDSLLRGFASIVRTLGETVLYRPDGGKGDPVEVSVVWSEDPEKMPEGIRATAWALAADFSNPAGGDVFERSGKIYKISGAPVPDGYGALTMNLRQVQGARE